MIYTNNAKTFKKAARDIMALQKVLSDGKFQSHCVAASIKRKFTAARAEWWGGFWERIARTVKVCLQKLLGHARLTFQMLITILYEIESTVNSRPPICLSKPPEDPEVLTPAHFLTEKRLTALPSSDQEVDLSREVVTRRWRHRNQMLEHFWKHWRKDYHLLLRSAHIADNQTLSMDVGDLVLISEKKALRKIWKIGRISEAYYGSDKIRACMVKLSNGSSLQRPIQLLYPLEFSS